MVSIAAQGKLQAKESETPLEHTIFQICLQCHYNTLRPSDCIPNTSCGPGYRCPECQKSSFVIACTICRFESSAECPLTRLLNKRSGQERRGRERCRKGDQGPSETECSTSLGPASRRSQLSQNESFDAPDMKKQCQDILKQFKKNGSKVHTAPQTKNSAPKLAAKSLSDPPTPPRTRPLSPGVPAPEQHPSYPKMAKTAKSLASVLHTKKSQPKHDPKSLPHSHQSRPPSPGLLTSPNSTKSPPHPAPPSKLHAGPAPTEPPRVYCSQCSQARCTTCKPGYMNLVVDMKEFSITFASEMALCTMCEHWLCPGSSLVVLYRCRECGHEGCDDCATSGDGLGEEWVACCYCAKGKGKGGEVVVDAA